MNDDKFFELWLSSKPVESSSFVTDTPLYWAWQGYLLGVKQERELRELNKEAEKNGEEL